MMTYRRTSPLGRFSPTIFTGMLTLAGACSALVDTSLPDDDGTGGRAVSSGGGTVGAQSHSGGQVGASEAGDVGGAAGEAGSGGAAGANGGADATGGTSTGGAAGGVSSSGAGGAVGASPGGETGGSSGGTTGLCLGQPNELVTKGWKITTKSHLSTIQPVTSDPRGIFQDGSCVCVSGRGSASSEFYAVVTFEDENGRLFKNLSLKLIHASSEPAWPTLYVRLKSGTQYCRVFSESQRNDLKDGKVIEIPHTDLHNKDAGGDCSTGQTDMRDGELISEVQLQVDNYEPNGRRDFNFCVPELTVNPGTPALAD